MNPLLFQSPREVMRDSLLDPVNQPVDPAKVDQALERRRHRQYRNHMLKLRLTAEFHILRNGLFSAEHRLMARLNGLVHPHPRPVAIRANKHRR